MPDFGDTVPGLRILANTVQGLDTKLAGVANGATANAPDAFLLSRTNHSGSQAQSTITDLTTDLAAKLSFAQTRRLQELCG